MLPRYVLYRRGWNLSCPLEHAYPMQSIAHPSLKRCPPRSSATVFVTSHAKPPHANTSEALRLQANSFDIRETITKHHRQPLIAVRRPISRGRSGQSRLEPCPCQKRDTYTPGHPRTRVCTKPHAGDHIRSRDHADVLTAYALADKRETALTTPYALTDLPALSFQQEEAATMAACASRDQGIHSR